MSVFTKKINEKSCKNIASVGAENASSADMYRFISSKHANGFTITSDAFRFFLKYNRIDDLLKELMDSVDTKNFVNLKEIAWWAGRIITTAQIPPDLRNEIKTAFAELVSQDAVSVRSSVVSEELSSKTFIGQHEIYLNIDTKEELLIAVKNCFASLYTDKAILYRRENKIEHNKVSISINVQRMPRSKQTNNAIFNLQATA
ncbi:MAG: PEP/pyruvate-binding domain-containing protein [Ginsengibacter sp.]